MTNTLHFCLNDLHLFTFQLRFHQRYVVYLCDNLKSMTKPGEQLELSYIATELLRQFVEKSQNFIAKVELLNVWPDQKL